MYAQSRATPQHYRVWIVQFDRCEPVRPDEVPAARAVALEPAEEGTMPAAEARAYVEAFNRVAARGRRRVRAVALPVVIRYQGEPRPGQALDTLPGARPDTSWATEVGPAEIGA